MANRGTGVAVAVLMGCMTCLPASAQNTQARPQGQQAEPQGAPSNRADGGATQAREVKLIGCLELEKDYRARVNAGKGGVLGSGIGAGNEYVLSSAIRAPEDLSTARPAGTSGSGGADYMLTGKNEPTMRREVGRQVHVLGTIEQPAGSNKELARVTVSAWHPMKDYCPAK